MIKPKTSLNMTTLALLLVSTAQVALADTVLAVDKDTSTANYTIVHKLHTVEATSKKVDGKVLIKPDGTVLVQMVTPVASFVSGSSGRDEHMQETMEVTKYPSVGFKGRGSITIPSSYPDTLKVDVKGELDFHGRKKEETIPVQVAFDSATQAHVTGTFNVSLDKYEVDRPSLLLVKINDDCRIDLNLALKQ